MEINNKDLFEFVEGSIGQYLYHLGYKPGSEIWKAMEEVLLNRAHTMINQPLEQTPT